MLYNKNNVRKTNDKKILHKVGKQWKVISVALLLAIGGGAAVATHANAQTTNAATNAEVTALDQKPSVQGPQSANSSSAASSSANAKSASAVSYLSGDNGSAASYHAKAENDNYSAQSNGAIVSGYVKSLNAKFGPVTKLLNGRTASASASAKSDASLSNSYANVAKNSDNKSGVNSLAAKSGLTANDYASNVSWNVENIYNPAVKSASANASALNLASGLAEKLMAVNFADVSAEAQANEGIASANSAVESAKSKAINEGNASTAVSKNNSALNSATLASISASGINAAMALTQSNDNSLVNSYAKSNSLDTTSVSSEVQSHAEANVKNNSYGATNYNFSNANSAIKNTSLLNNVVSDAASLYSANSVTARANSVIASAIAAKPSLSANLVSAKAASKANSVASASADAAYSVANDINHAVNYINAHTNMSGNADAKASGVNFILNNHGTIRAMFNNLNKSNAYEDADIASVAASAGVNLAALKNAEPAIKSMAKAAPSFNNASELSSVASSVAKSVATNLANTTSASASYANSTDENVTLASYFASSYSVNASSNASLASSYANRANAFYVANINNPKFTSADNAMKAAKAAEPNDAALADAYGQRVYNYAPKYITTQKTFGLYNVNGKKYTRLATVPAGVRLTVNGVHIAENGQVRYEVDYRGNKGTVNSYPSYVQQTYLPVQNDVQINVIKPSKVYNNVNAKGFTNSIGTVKAGTPLNVNIVSADGVYGGFTAAQILGGKLNGKLISANIAYAAKVGSNNSANNNNNNNHNNNVPPYSFN